MTDFIESVNNAALSRSQDHYDALKQIELQNAKIAQQALQNAVNLANSVSFNNATVQHFANIKYLEAGTNLDAVELKTFADAQTQVAGLNKQTLDNDEDVRTMAQAILKQVLDNDDLKNVFETLIAKYLQEMANK